MNLLAPLASGVNGAANGVAILYARGTTTPVTYYKDFEASQAVASTAAGVALDANGRLIAYVNQLTDVLVLDVNGVVLCEFVGGAAAASVEVISQSFTGTRYVDGSTGAGYPTTLQAVLDLIFGSFGATNFKVLANGSALTLQAAFASFSNLFFNVRTYGAFGDGVADDGASIQAAIAAAAATSTTGGIVFFPPGVYRSTAIITLPTGVSMMGTGGVSSKLAFDSAIIAEGLLVNLSQPCVTTITGMWITTINTNFVNPLVQVAAGGAAVTIADCYLGNSTTTKGNVIKNTSVAGAYSNLVVERCLLQNNADITMVSQTSNGKTTLRGCTFTIGFVGAYSSVMLSLIENFLVDNCTFNSTTATSGTCIYVQFAPTTNSTRAIISNNLFGGNSGITVTALKNSLAVPIYDCQEYGNTFGDVNGVVLAYAYATDGYADIVNMVTTRSHGSRVGRSATYITNANQLIDAKSYGVISIRRSGAGAQTLTGTQGSLGDVLTVAVLNESGGALNVQFGAQFAMDLGVVIIAVNPAQRGYVQFMWLSANPSGTAGQWVQTSKLTTGVL